MASAKEKLRDLVMKTILYARYSPRPDGKDRSAVLSGAIPETESNQTQFEQCRAYAISKGWPHDPRDEHQDECLSGDDENRPGLWNAIEDLGKGDVLLVYKLDRLARSAYFSHIVEQAVQSKGARIVSVTGEGTWSDSHEDQLIRRILQALGEYQKKVMAARTKAAMLRHQAHGRRMSGQAPFGWAKDPTSALNKYGRPGWMVKIPEEQAVILRIRELWQEKGTYGGVCTALNREGVPCRGGKWHRAQVKRILLRPG
jgi:site-specific DNA recombinase